MGLFHDLLLEARTDQFEKDLKEAYGMGFRDGRLCPEELRPCLVDGKPALFHRWAEEDRAILKPRAKVPLDALPAIRRIFEEHNVVPASCDAEVMRATYAIVEYPDGSVGHVTPELVCFTDREEV